MELNSTQEKDRKTTIQLTKATLDQLSDCKQCKNCRHRDETYDKIIQKLMKYHHEQTGSTVVE